MRIPVLVCGCILLAACASGPAPVSPQSPEAKRGSGAAATPAVTAPGASATPASSPVDSLLADARRLRLANDLVGSLARLERALRIAPRDARVYLELARTHIAAGEVSRASASAERGMLYCSGTLCRELQRYIEA